MVNTDFRSAMEGSSTAASGLLMQDFAPPLLLAGFVVAPRMQVSLSSLIARFQEYKSIVYNLMAPNPLHKLAAHPVALMGVRSQRFFFLMKTQLTTDL